MRNQEKFESAENEYKAARQMVDNKSKSILEKLDLVKINLSVRFFDKITTKFYEVFDEVHSKMNNVQNELNDIETRRANLPLKSHERFNTESGYVGEQ